MLRSKQFLVGGSVVGALLLVYGTAVLYRLLMGNYLLAGGLTDLYYLYLALLCAVPFVIVGMVGSSEKNLNTVIASGVLFTILFIVVHWAFVFSGEFVTGKELGRMMTIFPISALLTVVATRIAFAGRANRESR